MCEIITRYKDYWTLVSADRAGNPKARGALELMASGQGKPAQLARAHLAGANREKVEQSDASG